MLRITRLISLKRKGLVFGVLTCPVEAFSWMVERMSLRSTRVVQFSLSRLAIMAATCTITLAFSSSVVNTSIFSYLSLFCLLPNSHMLDMLPDVKPPTVIGMCLPLGQPGLAVEVKGWDGVPNWVPFSQSGHPMTSSTLGSI